MGEWTTYDNPYMEEKWRKRLAEMVVINPKIVETPGYKRMYLGQWVTDIDDLCYKYSPYINTAPKLPENKHVYVLGIDLGYSPDPSAFVVSAYSFTDRSLYFVEAYKQKEMIISAVATRIAYYQKKFDIHTMVIDNASKQAVEELKQRFSLPLIAADKAGKADFIEIMNSELIGGLIKVLPEAEELATEWEDLIWDDKATKRVEHPGCANHLADAALYNWRHCYQHFSKAPETKKVSAPEEVMEDWWDQEAEKMSLGKEQQFWEREYQ